MSLEQCQTLARENYPLVSQRGLIEKTGEFTVSNAKRNWLPQISLSAQAVYQSEVMTIPEDLLNTMDKMKENPLISSMIDMPDLDYKGLRKDQYRATVQVEQVIYGGGAIKAQVESARAESEVNKQSWETEMYKLRERVNQLYFGSLLLQEKAKEVDLLISELERNKRLVQSYMEFGVSGPSDVDKIQAEILTAQQQQSEITASQKAYRTMLGIMTGQEITEQTVLAKPEAEAVPNDIKINRPELSFFDAQERMLDAQKKGINSMIKPQIGAFFQGSVGNPGLDYFDAMFNRQWSPYFVAGVQLKWNISGFYTRKGNLNKIDVARSQIASQRETFLYNMNLQSTQELIGINRMYDVMKQDDEIINLRSAIRKRTEAGVANGDASVNDLLKDMHAENLARQNKITHEIELLKDIYSLKHTTNYQ